MRYAKSDRISIVTRYEEMGNEVYVTGQIKTSQGGSMEEEGKMGAEEEGLQQSYSITYSILEPGAPAEMANVKV